MTYHAGLRGFGGADRDPHVTCDGCGLVAHGLTRDGAPRAWMREGRAVPGWTMLRTVDKETCAVTRVDTCKVCVSAKRLDTRHCTNLLGPCGDPK